MQSDAIAATLPGCCSSHSQKHAVLNLRDQKHHASQHTLPAHFQEHHRVLHTLEGDDGMVTSETRSDCLWGLVQCSRSAVAVSALLLKAGGRSCQGEICSLGKTSTACSLSEQGGKGTSLFSIFTKCKSVKPLMACHLDGNCSPFRGRQVKGRACGCSLFFFFFLLQVLMWKAFRLSGDYCHIYV